MTPEQTLNQQIKNYLNDVPTPDRVACYICDKRLEVCLGGPHVFWYNPETNKITIKKSYSCLKSIDGRLIDKSILKQIYQKILMKGKTISLDNQLKKEFKIDKKSKLNQKDLETIAKYENAFKTNK